MASFAATTLQIAHMAKPYDSILKEIFEQVIPELAPVLLHIGWGEVEELKDKTQITLEREADYLKKLLYENRSDNFILHVEFHLKEEDLRNWMLLQRSMLRYKYRLPVRQVVFYIGNKEVPNIPSVIDEINLTASFDVISFKAVPAEVFLNSQAPEVVMLTILSNFGRETPEEILPKILDKLLKLAKNPGKLKQLQRQLEVLSNLRKLQPLTIKFIEAMPIIYDIESDVRFQQGIEKGFEKAEEKMERQFVVNLLNEGNIPLGKIARLADVPLEFVLKIQKELKLKKKTPGHPKSGNGQ